MTEKKQFKKLFRRKRFAIRNPKTGMFYFTLEDLKDDTIGSVVFREQKEIDFDDKNFAKKKDLSGESRSQLQ